MMWRKRVGAITKEANANPRAAQHLAPVKKSPAKKKKIVEEPSDSSDDGGELHTKWINNVSSQSEKNDKEVTKKKTNTHKSEAAKNLVTRKPVSNALSQIGFVDSDDEDIEVKPQPIKVSKTKFKHAEVVPETQMIDSSDDEDSMLEKMKGKTQAKKKTVSPPVCEEESTSSSENEGSQKINLKRILSQDSQETEQPMKKKQKRDEEITDDTSDQYSEEEVKSSNRKKTIVEYESEDYSSEEDVKPKSKKTTKKFLSLSLDSEDEQYIDYFEKQPKHKKATKTRSDQEESDDSEDFDAMSSSYTEKGKKRVASDDEMEDDDDEFSDPELWDEEVEDDDVLEVYSSQKKAKKEKYDDIEEYDSMDDFIDQHYETKKKKQTSIKDFTKKGTSPIERKKRLHKNTKAVPDKLVNKENGWSYCEYDDEYVLINNGKKFRLYSEVYDKLYDYQHQGVKWLTTRYCSSEFPGGILADDMGLGKTVQISSFINGLFESKLAYRVMIVAPVSVIMTWVKELKKWTPNCKNVVNYHNVNTSDRRRTLRSVNDGVKRNGSAVIITSYGTIQAQADLIQKEFKDTTFDLIILDEGHKIKNTKAKTTNSLRSAIKARSKFALTGTPIMNRINEMWALYDYIFDGEFLGSLADFKKTYERGIINSSKRDARNSDKVRGNLLSKELNDKISPYFLRRTKADVVTVDNALEYTKEKQSSTAKITQKNDFVVWCAISPAQEKVYRAFLTSSEVKGALSKSHSALASFTVLKLICDHHILCKGFNELEKRRLREKEEEELEKLKQKEDEDAANDFLPVFKIAANDDEMQQALEKYEDEAEAEVKLRIKETPVSQLVEESTKLKLMKDLLLSHKKTGHRTLIFTQYARMLDIVERVIKEDLRLKYLRIDGSISSSKARQEKVDLFNDNDKYSCFILTTQVGGIGLTLTGASRVILLDANWNPALDNQAVDRSYRIGQRKNVVVYRLISCETIEEKIYRKQVFKNTLSKNVQEKSNQYRYFNDAELREMLSLPEDVHKSKTCTQLQKLHAASRITYPELIEHVKELENLHSVVGLTDHDQLFKKEADDDLQEAEVEVKMDRYLKLQQEHERKIQARMVSAREQILQDIQRRQRMQLEAAMINSGVSASVASNSTYQQSLGSSLSDSFRTPQSSLSRSYPSDQSLFQMVSNTPINLVSPPRRQQPAQPTPSVSLDSYNGENESLPSLLPMIDIDLPVANKKPFTSFTESIVEIDSDVDSD